jgi:hypothetical protein
LFSAGTPLSSFTCVYPHLVAMALDRRGCGLNHLAALLLAKQAHIHTPHVFWQLDYKNNSFTVIQE